MNNMNKNKGITLIALIVTIVVLLILVGVSLNLLVGDNGLIGKTHEAKDGYKNSQENHEEKFDIMSNFIDKELNEHDDYLDPEINPNPSPNPDPEINPNPDPEIKPNPNPETKGNIPEGGKYYIALTDNELKEVGYDINSCEGILIGGKDNFPISPKRGDTFVYGDYEYRFEKEYHKHSSGALDWIDKVFDGNWGARVINPNKQRYEPMLSNINGVNVDTAIYAYGECPNLVEAPVLPDTIKYVKYIYRGCSKLETIQAFPKGITEIKGACRGCIVLKNIYDFPLDMQILELVDTFRDCYNLETMPQLPVSVQNLDSTFKNCYKLKNLKAIPVNVTNMYRTFYRCYAITNPPILPPNVTSLERTFERCYELLEAPKIPSKVTNLAATFKRCFKIERAPEIPDTVNNMLCTFEYCINMKYPPSKLPSHITELNQTFKDTVLLNYPEIPSSVIHLDETFSYSLDWKNEIFYIIDEKGNVLDDLRQYEKQKQCNIKQAPTIPYGVQSLYFTFQNNYIIESCGDIPDSVTTMTATFASCNNFKKIGKLSSNLTNMASVFVYCENFNQKVVIPSTVNNLHETFRATAITEFPIIPENVETLSGTFMECYLVKGDLLIKSNKITYVENMLKGCCDSVEHSCNLKGTPENLQIRQLIKETNIPLDFQSFSIGQYINII